MQEPDGTVRLLHHLATGATFDVDRVDVDGTDAVEKRVTAALRGSAEAGAMLAREAAFLDVVRLPFLPRLLGHHAAGPSTPERVHETFLPGEHLSIVLEPRPVLARAAILARLVNAMITLHAIADARGALGAFHGDVSPTNVLVDATGTIGLVDFGAAGTRDLPAFATQGTPPYAPPEVVRGEARVDQAADRYALAVITVEALTGGLAPARAPATRLRELPEAARLLAVGDGGVVPLPSNDEATQPILGLLRDMIAFRQADRPRDLDALGEALFLLAARARKSEIDRRR
jgi:serine/threonine protein kinase